MPSVKITELNSIYLRANTANTVFLGVDLPTDITGQITGTALAYGLYSNNPLKVGNNQILFANTIAQFASNSNTYMQINVQNFNSNGSSDLILTSDTGTDGNNYIDVGINNSTFNDPNYSSMGALDGYLYVIGPNSSANQANLIIGTASYGSNIKFIAGGTTANDVVAVFNEDILYFNEPLLINHIPYDADDVNYVVLQVNNYGNGYSLLVNDESNDSSPFAIDQSGNVSIGTASSLGYKLYVSGNTYVSGNVITSNNFILSDGSIAASNTFVNANDGITLTTAKSYTDTANTYLRANDGITLTTAKSYTDTANNYLLANDSLTLTTAKNYVDAANTYLRANDGTTLTTAKSYTDAANSFIVANYVANSSVINVASVTMTGNLSIIGNGASLSVNNSTFNNNTSLVKITASNNYVTIPPSNQDYLLQITGKDGAPTRVILDSFGSGGTTGSYSVIAGRSGRGSASSPTRTLSGDVLMRVGGNGYSNSGFVGAGAGRIDITAVEDFTDSTKGTNIVFWTTNAGTNTVNTATFTGNTVSFTGYVNPQKGFVYNPKSITGNSTNIMIDFATDSIIRTTVNSSYTVSFANYTPGKSVDIWVTNLATNPTQTFTSNVSAINSTLNSATYTHPTLSTIVLRYMSFGGDLANVYLSVIK